MNIARPVNTPTGSARSKPNSASADAVEDRQHHHHQQLPAQVLAEHLVAFVDEAVRRAARSRGGTSSAHALRPAASSPAAGRTAPPAPGRRCRSARAATLPPMRAELNAVGSQSSRLRVERTSSTKALMLARSSATLMPNCASQGASAAVEALDQQRHLLAHQRQLLRRATGTISSSTRQQRGRSRATSTSDHRETRGMRRAHQRARPPGAAHRPAPRRRRRA